MCNERKIFDMTMKMTFIVLISIIYKKQCTYATVNKSYKTQKTSANKHTHWWIILNLQMI